MEVVRKLHVLFFAVATIVTAGLLTTTVGNGDCSYCCDAFSAAPSPMRMRIRTRTASGAMGTTKRGATLAPATESSDETTMTPTISKDDDEQQQETTTEQENDLVVVSIEDNNHNRQEDGKRDETSASANTSTPPPFDEAAWETYKTLMEEILTQPRAVKNSDQETIEKCRAYLLSYENYLTEVPDIVPIVGTNNHDDDDDDGSQNKKEALESILEERQNRFQQRFDFTNDQVQFVNRCLVYMGDACAREQSKQNRKAQKKVSNGDSNGDSNDQLDPRLPIVVVWHKIKELGLVIREKSLSSYMYILSSTRGGQQQQQQHSGGSASDSDSDALIDDSLLEVVSCYDAIYGSSEKTVTIRLKGLIARGKFDEAEAMFAASFDDSSCGLDDRSDDSDSDDETIRGRLRTYMPLMEYYCTVGDLKSTLRLYRQMQNCAGVHWDIESYTILLSSLARFGYFFGDKQQMGEREGDYNDLYGPKLFDSLVSNMANDILELTEATSVELLDAFRAGIKNHLNLEQQQEEEDTSVVVADDPSEDQSRSQAETAPSPKTVVVDRVEITKDNGTCPATGVKLRLLALANEQRQHVHDTLLEMSKKNTEEFLASNIKWQETNQVSNPATKGNIEKMTSKLEESYGYEELRKFSEWLDEREGNLFTTIVDGANVAYYGHSNVHYSSLKRVVEKLESMGERPLVVMPEKYTWKKFFVRPRYYQKLTEKDLEVIEWLKEREIVYVVPRYVLDDYFWMLASVSNQTNATQRGDLSIPIGDDQGRFPGMRPMLVTNDQMRDHKLDLLEPREFRRWCSCHIVNYDISEYKEDEWEDARQISLVPADSFSREIQSNTPATGNGNVWHFPIGDNSSDWLCIWIQA